MSATDETEKDESWWQTPARFALETLVGLFIFMVVAFAAVGLNLMVNKLKTIGVDTPIIWGLIGGEYLLFVVDCVLFAKFMWSTFLRTWKEL